ARHIQRPLAICDNQAVIRRVIGVVEVHRQAVAFRQLHATADHQLVVTGDEVGRIRRVFCDAVDAYRARRVVTVCADFGINYDGLCRLIAVTCRICHGRGHVVRAIC
ncbi:hypothetical protein AB4180_22780, partial [Vibrio sp. 10N.286.49.C3]|uniref:hypothetical protein n=1 Tax=Vibrio sp. 10N.286.49.C3 TaxID=3229701 RepID=UPI00355457D0